jgi:hypothetical protein
MHKLGADLRKNKYTFLRRLLFTCFPILTKIGMMAYRQILVTTTDTKFH